MINVIFPPGCYGTYIARCLYNYTNLRNSPFTDFEFDSAGSSHYHRENTHARSVIKAKHVDTFDHSSPVQLVVVPCVEHGLDYYNNQFVKNQHSQLIRYITKQMPKEEVNHKLKHQWNYHGEFDATVPRWIMREWCSYWIADALNSAYNTTTYHMLDSTVKISTKDIFENYTETLTKIVSALELTFTVDQDKIDIQHNKFLAVQKFHNSQNRCYQYVQDLLAGVNTNIYVHSIFDEAYIQHLLRQHNIEIQCDGLNTFPDSTHHLRTIIYETMHNTNT
jgi:hypothetical protein